MSLLYRNYRPIVAFLENATIGAPYSGVSKHHYCTIIIDQFFIFYKGYSSVLECHYKRFFFFFYGKFFLIELKLQLN